MSDRELIQQLRLGEDSHLEFKSVRVRRGRQSPRSQRYGR